MTRQLKALVIGGAMVDTIAIVDSRHIERMSMNNAAESYLLLAEGSKTEALEISTHTGGGAINAAVALARLGADVAPLAVLGRDQRGEAILARLVEEGISTRWIVREDRATTGASVFVASHERNAAIFTYRGANTLLEPQHLRPDAFSVDLVYVSGLSNRSADCFPEIMRLGKGTGAFVATNPGTRQLSSRGTILAASLAQIDLLAINRAEADTMVPNLVAKLSDGGPPIGGGQQGSDTGDVPPLAVRGLIGGGHELSLRAFLTRLLDMGAGHILVTDGRHGAFLANRHAIFHCPAAPVKVAGTAGAGDAFAATLAAFLAGGADAETALRAASFNAASVVGSVDTQSGLLTGRALADLVAARAGELAVQKWAL